MQHRISRRNALASFGIAGLGAVVAACSRGGGNGSAGTTSTSASPTTAASAGGTGNATGVVTAAMFDEATSCTIAPEMTEGPYYFDVDTMRRDLSEDREGAPLRLGVRVREGASCTPLPDAVVDVWHCDALGLYSGFEAASTGPGGGAGRTDDETYCRGAQVTNADGITEFVTVYPGWYRGRTVHIHAKVHLDGSTMLTTQLFFDDDFTAGISGREPYASDGGRDTFNDDDSIFDDALLLTLSERSDEYLGLITLDVAG
jgi:protocatechuate 3,4-dioxygenase beta subunit